MDFNAASVRDQLQIYLDLGVCVDNAKAALAEIPSSAEASAETPKRVLLFTGHRIDDDKRPHPRFPKRRNRSREMR